MGPTTGLWQHLHLPVSIPINLLVKTIGQLAIGIVLRQYNEVWESFVDAHGSTSPRISAPTRSPCTLNCSSLRTIVGSRWLLLKSTRVFSSEKRRMASGLCEVAMNCPLDWKLLRRANTKCPTSSSAR